VRRILDGLDRYQQRHSALALPVAVVKKFGDDGANREAALIAYWGFFSLFPLLLLFVAVLGFVLAGDPGAQRSIANSALSNFPILGPSVAHGRLTGSGVALVVGIVGAVLSGTSVTNAAQDAFNKVFAVPKRERPNALVARVRGLGLLVVFGVLQVLATGANGVVSAGLGGVGLTIAGIAVSLALNALLFFAVFRLLTDNSVETRDLRPGIAIATVLWTILQAVGGVYVHHVVQSANNTYGTFATVIGLLTWLYLGARIVVYAAEINSVLTARLYPRSLFGEPKTEADFRAKAAVARIEEQVDDERISTRFARADGEDRVVRPEVPHGANG
jgi:YihY family inner membrane protein